MLRVGETVLYGLKRCGNARARGSLSIPTAIWCYNSRFVDFPSGAASVGEPYTRVCNVARFCCNSAGNISQTNIPPCSRGLRNAVCEPLYHSIHSATVCHICTRADSWSCPVPNQTACHKFLGGSGGISPRIRNLETVNTVHLAIHYHWLTNNMHVTVTYIVYSIITPKCFGNICTSFMVSQSQPFLS